MELTPQQQRVIDFLADGEWHCMTDNFFMKDDRKRISELNGMGFEIKGIKCDKRCKTNHHGRILMRKLVARPDGIEVKPKPIVYMVKHPFEDRMISTNEYALL